MKKIIAAVLTMLMVFCGCVPALAGARPLLYRVEDEAGHRIYLLGTIHIGRESMYPLSAAVEAAYDEAEILAVELDVVAYRNNFLKSLLSTAKLTYGLFDSADRHLSPEVYAMGVEKLGLPEYTLRRLRPGAWLSLAENWMYEQTGLSAELGVDMHLLGRAHADGKQIDELEGYDSQMAVMLGLPDEIVDLQLQSTLKYPHVSGLSLKLMLQAWENGDERTLTRYVQTDTSALPGELREVYQEFLDMMYHDRDSGFEEQARAYLKAGKTVLLAVGAAHIVGPGALADRLAQAGYTVTEIGR